MTLSEMALAAHDFWRPNRYALKPYLLNDGKPHPVAVICPGGGYGMVCSFIEGQPIAKALNQKGYAAVVVYYRVKKAARYPAPQEDLICAIRTVFDRAAEWNIDPNGYSLWGSSAGGHLAASVCTAEWKGKKPAALILSYPVVTMGEATHTGSRENLLGKGADAAAIDRMSVERHITKDFPPTYVWNGTKDTVVDPVNSRMLKEALQAAGVPHRAEVFSDVGHGVGLAKGTNAEPWLEHAIAFWEENR